MNTPKLWHDLPILEADVDDEAWDWEEEVEWDEEEELESLF